MLSKSDWEATSPEEWELLAGIANEARGWERHTAAEARAVVRRLPFYAHRNLYLVASREGADLELTYFLWDPRPHSDSQPHRQPALLDGESVPIHFANRDAESPLELVGEGPTDTAHRVDEYLRFFCEFVHGDEGAFSIIEHADEVEWVEPSADDESRPGGGDQFDLTFVEPDEAPEGHADGESSDESPQSGDREVAFRRTATVSYAGFLFRAQFRIPTDGKVEMLGDEPLDSSEVIREVRGGGLRALREHYPKFARGPRRRPSAGPRERVTGDQFVERVRDAGGTPVERLIVSGKVDLTGHHATERVTIRNVEFRGAVDLSDARFERGLELFICTFKTFVDGANMLVDQGGVTIWRCEFSGNDVQSNQGQALNLAGSRAYGRLHLADSFVHDGSVSLANLDVQGQLHISGLHVLKGGVNTSWSRFDSIECNSRVERPAPSSIAGHLNLSGVVVRGGAHFHGLYVGGYVLVWSSSFGSLIFSAGRSPRRPRQELSAAAVAPSDGDTGVDPPTPKHGVEPTRIEGGMLLRATRVERFVEFQGFYVTGRNAPKEIEGSEERSGWQEVVRGGLHIENCEIGGELTIAGQRVRRWSTVALQAELGVPTVIRSHLNLSGSTVRGQLDLRDTHVGLSIVADGVELKRGLNAGHAGRVGKWTHLEKGREVGEEDGAQLQITARRGTTRCASFSLRDATCGGDVDLTNLICDPDRTGFAEIDGESTIDLEPATVGLEVESIAKRISTFKLPRAGHVQLEGTNIGGNLVLGDLARLRKPHPDEPIGGHRGASIIPGALDLTGVVANRLVLTGEGFTNHDACLSARDDGIVLVRARFREFDLLEPLPVRLDMRNMQVGNWSFESDRNLETFERLLEADEHKLRGTYTSIEASLTRRNRTEDAEQIRKAMWRAAKARSARLSRMRFKFWFLEKFGYGWPWASAGALVGLVLLLTLIFRNPSHVSPSLAYLGADGNRSPGPDVTVQSGFGQWDALSLSLRYSVPMLGLITEQDWRATPYRGPLFDDPDRRFGPSYEDIGAIVSILSWCIWAVLLVSVSGLTRRLGLANQQS